MSKRQCPSGAVGSFRSDTKPLVCSRRGCTDSEEYKGESVQKGQFLGGDPPRLDAGTAAGARVYVGPGGATPRLAECRRQLAVAPRTAPAPAASATSGWRPKRQQPECPGSRALLQRVPSRELELHWDLCQVLRPTEAQFSGNPFANLPSVEREKSGRGTSKGANRNH